MYFSDVFFSALDSSSGTATNSVNTNYFPSASDIEPVIPKKVFPYKYPYFLFPPSHKIPLALASHRPATSDSYYSPATIYSYDNNNHNNYNISSPYDMDDALNTNLKHFNRKNSSLHKFQHQHQGTFIDNMDDKTLHINNFNRTISSSTPDVVKLHKNQQDYVKHRLEIGEVFRPEKIFFCYFFGLFVRKKKGNLFWNSEWIW